MAFHRPRAAGALIVCLLAATGCSSPAPAEVTGVVRCDGKLVRVGSVLVFDEAGAPHAGDIRQDGTYKVWGIPAGPIQVAVQSLEPRRAPPARPGRKNQDNPDPNLVPPPPPEAPAEPRDWFRLPSRFSIPATSGLSTTLNPGPNTFDIDLK